MQLYLMHSMPRPVPLGSISLRWSFITDIRVAFVKVVFHCSGPTSGWYIIRVITVEGGIFFRVASHGGISSG